MLYCLIMAGGKGERFWPKSRIKSPKQMLSVATRKTMIEETLTRLETFIDKSRIFVITNKEQVASLRKLALLERKRVIAEPLSCNTAPAIGLGAILIKRENPQAIMVCLPADHIISKKTRFRRVLSLASHLARQRDALVTIGINPTYPATGYGYIRIKKMDDKKEGVFEVEGFTEKPRKEEAERFLRSGRYLWNSGIFVWKVSVILKAIKEHLPQLYTALMRIERSLGKREARKVIREVYCELKPISIDYGVMEKARENVLVIKGDFGWTDMGCWRAFWEFHKKDEKGNVCQGRSVNIDTHNSLIIGDKKRMIATLGLSDMVVVQTEDATLICPKERAQDVKILVKEIKRRRGMSRFL